MEKLEKAKLEIGLILAGIVAVVALAAGFIWGDPSDRAKVKVHYTKELKAESEDPSAFVSAEANEELADVYKADMSAYYDGANIGSMYFVMDKENGTYTMVYGYQEAVKGTYAAEGNEVLLTYEGQAEPVRYILDEHTLIAETNICKGELPEADTFDLTCTQRSSETSVYYYEFKQDGSYSLTNYTKGSSGSDKKNSAEGTYTKDGRYIKTIINGQATAPYLIYKNHMVTSFFEEISMEQFEEELAANLQYAIEQQAAQAEAAAAAEEVTEEVTEVVEVTETVEATEE